VVHSLSTVRREPEVHDQNMLFKRTLNAKTLSPSQSTRALKAKPQHILIQEMEP
jgi:hypothetical protein